MSAARGYVTIFPGVQSSLITIEIMPEVKLGPEAQPRDANNRGVLFILDT